MPRNPLVLAVVLLTVIIGYTPAPASDLETHKDLVRQFTEATNAADWDALAAIVSEDFTRHSAATPGPPVTSREQFVELQKGYLESMPDQHVELEQLIAEGDRVAISGIYSGTQTGAMGVFPPTGEAVRSPFLAIFRIEDGQIAELWVEWDNLAMLMQLGHFPSPPSSDE